MYSNKKDDEHSKFRMPKFPTFPSLGDYNFNQTIMSLDYDSEQQETDDTQLCTVSNGANNHSENVPQQAITNSTNGAINDKGPETSHTSDLYPRLPSIDSESSQRSDESYSSFTPLEESDIQGPSYGDITPEHVRWFYKENDKKLTPFIGFDSLRIELKYRELKGFDEKLFEASLKTLPADEIELLKTNDKIFVRGGLYEVDVTSRLCTSIFWAGDLSTILRGIWFYDGSWQPLEEPDADKIEFEHLMKFRDFKAEDAQPESPKKAVAQALHHIQFPGFHVEWYGPTEVYYYSENKFFKIGRSVTERFGFPKYGIKLQRGYYGDATPMDKQPDITHLVFVIHGVGQKRDTQRIIRNCGSLRKCAGWLKEKYFSNLVASNERSEFFPVEWRSSLKLDGDTVDSITLHQVRGLREFLNYSAMDVLYYTSPLYRMELIKGLQVELNRLYDLFCQRNPNFKEHGGKVSIVAHSLGCVIAYDVMTNWNPAQLYESYLVNNDELLLQAMGSSTEKQEVMLKLHKARQEVYALEQQLDILNNPKLPPYNLHFSVENFFCLGSPLAVFLALRGVRPGTTGLQHEIVPSNFVKRLFNIYHPTDPVAYRLEPLILKSYSTITPLSVHFYGSNDKKPYEEMKAEPISRELLDKRPQSPSSEDVLEPNTGSPSKSAKVESRWSGWSVMGWARRKNSNAPTTNQEFECDSEEMVTLMEAPVDAVAEALAPLECVNGSDSSLTEECNGSKESVVRVPSAGRLSPLSNSYSSDSNSPKSPEEPELEYRLDYVLREGNLEISSLSALTSHTAYWTSYDVAYFILSYLHPSADSEPMGSRSTSPTRSIK